MVKEAASSAAPTASTVRFVVTDTAKDMPVVYTGILPDLFREGKGVVAQGRLRRRRHLRRQRGAGQARRELHAAGSRQGVAMKQCRAAPGMANDADSRRRHEHDSRTRPLRADPRAAAWRSSRAPCRWSARTAAAPAWIALARPAAVGRCALLVTFAFACLT